MYYFGTNLGGSISTGDPGGIDLLRAVISKTIQPPVTSSGALRPRLIEGSGRGLLTVFNDTDTDQTGTVFVPAGYQRAPDVYSEEHRTIKDNKLDITVPFKDVGVFDLY